MTELLFACFVIFLLSYFFSKVFVFLKIKRLQKNGLYPHESDESNMSYVVRLVAANEIGMACRLYRQIYKVSLREAHQQVKNMSSCRETSHSRRR